MTSSDSHPASTGSTHSLREVKLLETGQTHGPITRLVSPSDLGALLKPFVFLDYFNAQIEPGFGFPMHPHSYPAARSRCCSAACTRWPLRSGSPVHPRSTAQGLQTIRAMGAELRAAGKSVSLADAPALWR